MEEKTTNHSFAILSLYRSDYAASLHVRAMAKKLNISHVTLLPHLKRLERNKILLSRKVGKNKEYLLNANNASVRHYITITEELVTINYLDKNFLIKKISASLSSLNLVGSMMLFGSYAKNYATEASDIDLFYLGKLTENQLSEIKNYGRIFGKEISIKTSSIENFQEGLRTSDALIKEIVENHIILQNPDPFINLLWRHHAER